MSKTTLRLTRKELYDLVWTRPIHGLATEFGLSGTGLAKICKRHDIPRPGRGHWAKLAVGKTSPRAPLPKARPRANLDIEIVQRDATPRAPKPPPRQVPSVVVPGDFRHPHDATRQLRSLADGKPFGDPPMHVLKARNDTTLRVSTESRNRALLALDALFKAVEARGHAVRMTHDRDSTRTSTTSIAIVVGEESVQIGLSEQAGQRPHELTAEEREREIRIGYNWARKYDRFTTGILEIRLIGRDGVRRRFGDGKRQRLEQNLGHFVLGIEDQAEAQRLQRQEAQRAAELAEQERRRREAEQKQEEHMTLLRKDLLRMTSCWVEAENIRAFLHAFETRFPGDEPSEAVTRWLAWARLFAEEYDPLSAPERVPKRMSFA